MKSLLIDCGTTNLRVTLLDDARKPIDTVKAEGGVRHTAIDGHNGRLKEMLKQSIDTVLAQNGVAADEIEHCVAYGMITSNVGLCEIPHVAAPASVKTLREHMQSRCFEDIAPFPIRFIPGVRNLQTAIDLDNFSAMDMMRGEETEAVGLYHLLGEKKPAVYVLPGSHNKFVSMGADGEILGCMTSISGELLDSLTHHTILADAVQHGFASAQDYDSRLACEGAWECSRSGLGRAAFAGRILSQLGGYTPEQLRSYLLGAVLALDVQALEAFAPEDASIFVAGKAPLQQAMIDVLDALGHEGAMAVEQPLSAQMGVEGAAQIAF